MDREQIARGGRHHALCWARGDQKGFPEEEALDIGKVPRSRRGASRGKRGQAEGQLGAGPKEEESSVSGRLGAGVSEEA